MTMIRNFVERALSFAQQVLDAYAAIAHGGDFVIRGGTLYGPYARIVECETGPDGFFAVIDIGSHRCVMEGENLFGPYVSTETWRRELVDDRVMRAVFCVNVVGAETCILEGHQYGPFDGGVKLEYLPQGLAVGRRKGEWYVGFGGRTHGPIDDPGDFQLGGGIRFGRCGRNGVIFARGGMTYAAFHGVVYGPYEKVNEDIPHAWNGDGIYAAREDGVWHVYREGNVLHGPFAQVLHLTTLDERRVLTDGRLTAIVSGEDGVERRVPL